MDNPSPKTICLQGDPGVGKSRMSCLTAIHKPVYVMDIDRKLRSAAWAQAGLASGDIICWELREPVDDSNIRSRILSLTTAITQQGPTIRPKGFVAWSEQFYKIPEVAKEYKIGTVAVQSLTLLNEHMKSMIMFDAKRSKFTFDQWSALKIGWMDTFSVMRDICMENNLDLIVEVHERVVGEPGEKTTGVEIIEVASKSEGISTQRIYKGTQDISILASIDGQFGSLIGAQTDEYYHLFVDASDKDHPQWRCRVWPDGRRNLRTSFSVKQAVFAPDFREIWK